MLLKKCMFVIYQATPYGVEWGCHTLSSVHSTKSIQAFAAKHSSKDAFRSFTKHLQCSLTESCRQRSLSLMYASAGSLLLLQLELVLEQKAGQRTGKLARRESSSWLGGLMSHMLNKRTKSPAASSLRRRSFPARQKSSLRSTSDRLLEPSLFVAGPAAATFLLDEKEDTKACRIESLQWQTLADPT
jgi:hypothetical protein